MLILSTMFQVLGLHGSWSFHWEWFCAQCSGTHGHRCSRLAPGGEAGEATEMALMLVICEA